MRQLSADVVKASIYVTDMGEYAKFNDVYTRRMAGCRPARELVEVSKLALGATIEITVTAYRPGALAG